MANPYKPIIWDSFSQQPARPELGNNPVTRVVNMELTPEKTVRTRRGFVAGLDCAAPDSHVTAHLIDSSKGSDLIMKVGDGIRKKVGDTDTEPIVLTSIHYNELSDGPGYFSVYGGEVYFCQENALFSITGEGARNLGLPPMMGGYDGSTPQLRSAVDFAQSSEWCAYYCVPRPGSEGASRDPAEGYKCCNNGSDGNCGFGESTETACTEEVNCGDDVGTLCSDLPGDHNTFICQPQQGTVGGIFCWHVADPAGQNARGEKILNCAFKVSYYDPKRNIYGKACDPKSVINFGPNRDQYSLYQYQILATKPTLGSSGLGFAIWCSIGQEVLSVKIPGMNLWHTILYDEVHAMSDHLTDMMFLEDRTNEDGEQEVDCGNDVGNMMCLFKDQATLADSGQYTDQYDRPVPSKAMAILPGGTALYFYPKEVKSIAGDCRYDEFIDERSSYSLGDHRPGVEYSVGHPEQVGRNTYNQKETFAPLPSLRGEPMYGMSIGGASMLFTRQTVYQLGFDRSPQVREVGGPGVLTHKSIHPTSGGVMYVADEGPVWFQGGKAVEILRELRFEGWIEHLTNQQREQVRIGLIEDCKKLLVSCPVLGADDRFKFLMHDFNDGFTSEWWLGNNQQVTPDTIDSSPGSNEVPQYMLSHKGDDGYSFYVWLDGVCFKYNPSIASSLGVESDSVSSYVEFWINENCQLEKQLGELIFHLGARSGNLNVRVSSFENPNDKTSNNTFNPLEERSTTVSAKSGTRVAMPDFSGMRGKYFRISIESNNVDFELMKVVADIKYDDDPRTDDSKNVFNTIPVSEP